MDRQTAYRHFGPKLLEAIVRKLIDEVNILRVEAGMLERTQQQAIDSVIDEYQGLPDYDWMSE